MQFERKNPEEESDTATDMSIERKKATLRWQHVKHSLKKSKQEQFHDKVQSNITCPTKFYKLISTK